jgi:hypothetical protein
MGTDKKRHTGRQRWVLPTDSGATITSDVPEDLVERVVTDLLSGARAQAGAA